MLVEVIHFRPLVKGVVLMVDSGFLNPDNSHAVRVVAEHAAHGGRDHQLHVFVPAAGVSVVMTAEDFPDAAVVELVQHFHPEVVLDVEVVFAFFGIFQEPGDVLELISSNNLMENVTKKLKAFYKYKTYFFKCSRFLGTVSEKEVG